MKRIRITEEVFETLKRLKNNESESITHFLNRKILELGALAAVRKTKNEKPVNPV